MSYLVVSDYTQLRNLQKSCGSSFKGDINLKLLNNACQFISPTAVLEKFTFQIFSAAFFFLACTGDCL